MKLQNQLFASMMRKPDNFGKQKTSALLESGIFTFFRDPGVPFYLPIGQAVLSNLEKVFFDESNKLGINNIHIPGIMRDSVLEEGEEIVDTFNERIIKLDNVNMPGYHLLTTPEPMILDLATLAINTHNQLPVRLAYNVEVVRGLAKPKGMLKGRQFKTFMANSLDADSSSVSNSLTLFETLSDKIFESLKIPIHKRRDQGFVDIEHFYLGSEGDNLIIPEINSNNRIKGLSLAMAYCYLPDNKLKARFRNKQNKNSRVSYVTYGLGTQRTFYSLFDSHRDAQGFNLPKHLVSHKYSIIPFNANSLKSSEELYSQIPSSMLDDRVKLSLGARASFSEYIGIPWKIICGQNSYSVKNRSNTIEKKFDDMGDVRNFINSLDSTRLI